MSHRSNQISPTPIFTKRHDWFRQGQVEGYVEGSDFLRCCRFRHRGVQLMKRQVAIAIQFGRRVINLIALPQMSAFSHLL